MPELQEKYHLPHNAIVIDEFNFMLSNIDLNKEFYLYEDLRLLFLQEQIKQNKLKVFHSAYDKNLKWHNNKQIVAIYKKCISDPSNDNLKLLLNCQYTPKKTFKQVFNETIRDYTEFFAFLGLLPTYYKGKAGGEKRHYVTQRLKDYRNGRISLEQLLFDFKYRNTSKDYDVLDMYQIKVRPYVIALKAAKHFFDAGFTKINNKILSAIVLYAKSEDEASLNKIYSLFDDPRKDVSYYAHLFSNDPLEFARIEKELGRATLQLRPYLLHMGYLGRDDKYYVEGTKKINEYLFTKKVAFCNSIVGNLSVTPVVGKILYKLYSCSLNNVEKIKVNDLFDSNVSNEDRSYLLSELKELGCIEIIDSQWLKITSVYNQVSINPYCDFFDFSDANYVAAIGNLISYKDPLFVAEKSARMEQELAAVRPIALGSNGTLYEQAMYNLINEHFGNTFDVKWYGGNATGKRLSDIFIKTTIWDGYDKKNIVIIIECKAGNAVKSFDERKEIDDVKNTLIKEKSESSIDGVWYWVVNGDSLPNADEHGGYRNNALSKSFIEKLGYIQFNVSELMRVPTIVTAFSFESIKNYISYLFDKIGDKSISVINETDVPHFWKWSKKFMNLQYVMVHKELRLNE